MKLCILECSRTADLANKFFGDSLSIKSRCQSDGSYDQLQCILNKNIEKSLCVCVDPDDGYPDEKSYGYLPTVGKENFPKCCKIIIYILHMCNECQKCVNFSFNASYLLLI